MPEIAAKIVNLFLNHIEDYLQASQYSWTTSQRLFPIITWIIFCNTRFKELWVAPYSHNKVSRTVFDQCVTAVVSYLLVLISFLFILVNLSGITNHNCVLILHLINICVNYWRQIKHEYLAVVEVFCHVHWFRLERKSILIFDLLFLLILVKSI